MINISPSITSLPSRTSEISSLLELWANINSGSGHLAGLERMRSKLRDAFASFKSSIIEEVTLPGSLAKALSVIMRPDATQRVLMSGHYETVYNAEHPFQTCTLMNADVLRGPGVADMKGGIVTMLAALQAFEQIPAACEIGWEELPGVLINVGFIHGGSDATNIVPDFAETELDVRITKVSDQAAVEKRLAELVATASEADGLRFEMTGEFNRPPKECGPVEEQVFAQWQSMAAELSIAPFTWVHSGGGSDGNFLSVAGLPKLGGVGPIGDHYHSENEYCLLSSIAEQAQIAALFLHRLAIGEIKLNSASPA